MSTPVQFASKEEFFSRSALLTLSQDELVHSQLMASDTETGQFEQREAVDWMLVALMEAFQDEIILSLRMVLSA